MPFARNSALPKSVRDVLPSTAQTIFRNVFNSQQGRGLSEARSFASAWAALENQGWEKGDDGKWRKVEKFEITGEIAKTDAPRRLVFGWASRVSKDGVPVEDSQGDIIDPEDIEEAAYDFALFSRDGGEMHDRLGVGKMVESVAFTEEKLAAMGLPAGSVDPGWWVGFKVDQDVFDKVKAGTYKMFSIGGVGRRVSV